MQTDATQKSSNRRKLYRYAYARVTVTVLLALLSAGALISVANDVYAFVKPDREATLRLESPTELSVIAKQLRRDGIIQNPTVFCWYVKSKGATPRLEAFTGDLPLHASMSYRELLLAFGGS